MRKRIEPGKGWSYHFDSLAELGRYLRDTPRTWHGCDSSEGPSYGKGWDLGCTYDEAERMAREGWLEGAQEAQQALKALALKSPEPDTKVDFYGFLPHVPRFCAGAPDSMIRRAREATGGMGKVITLYVPVNAVGGVDAKYMRNFGLGVAQYINQLETDGVRVELYGVICSEQGYSYSGDAPALTHSWRIKTADQPLDLAVLAFSVGHPAMFRRLGFALRERSDAPRNPGYGRSRPAKLSDLIDPPNGAYVLNGMTIANEIARTPKDAVEYVKRQIDAMLETPDAG